MNTSIQSGFLDTFGSPGNRDFLPQVAPAAMLRLATATMNTELLFGCSNPGRFPFGFHFLHRKIMKNG